MLVDLAANDLSRNTDQVEVEVFREVQYYSHVLHLVSSVSGKMKPETKIIKLFADTFPLERFGSSKDKGHAAD